MNDIHSDIIARNHPISEPPTWAAIGTQGVRAALILEMIGYFSDEEGSQQYPTSLMRAMYPSTGNFISIVGGVPDRGIVKTCKESMREAAPLPVIAPIILRAIENVHLSDHRNYWKFDFPAVMIGDTAFYRNPHYHQPTDTWDRLDYTRMAYVVIQTHQAVIDLAKK